MREKWLENSSKFAPVPFPNLDADDDLDANVSGVNRLPPKFPKAEKSQNVPLKSSSIKKPIKYNQSTKLFQSDGIFHMQIDRKIAEIVFSRKRE
jgi:hypothetical protein